MRNLPQKILLPRQEAKLQQLTQLLLRLRELAQQESMERKVVLADFLAEVAAVKVDKVDKVVAAVVKAVKVVKVVDKVVAAAVKVDKVVAAAVKVDKVVKVVESAEIGLQIKELGVGQIEFCHG